MQPYLAATQGACATGRCVARTPSLFTGSAPLAGHHRVIVLLGDETPARTGSICDDRASELSTALRLPEVLGWLGDVMEARTGRRDEALRVSVHAGFRREEVMPADTTPAAYVAGAERLLMGRCGWPRLAERFSRVVVQSPEIDESSRVYDFDRVHLATWQPWVFMHELLHTFGATDLYSTLGGQLQWNAGLMQFASGPTASVPRRTDVVAWGEVGLGDADRNGVIDAYDWIAEPESMEPGDVTVQVVRGRSLTIRSPFSLVRGARRHAVLPPEASYELPDFGVTLHGSMRAVETHDGRQVHAPYATAREAMLDAIAAAGRVRVRIRAGYTFHDARYAPRRLTVDRTVEVPVTVR